MHLDTYKQYLAALEAFATGDALKKYFTDDAIVHELPNRLVPAGRDRNLPALIEASAQAPKLISEQRYVIRQALEKDDTLALDVDWTATIKIPLGQTPAGGKLKARLAMWVRFRDGLICEQTNFDCYDPF
jgi:hypothetical protein